MADHNNDDVIISQSLKENEKCDYCTKQYKDLKFCSKCRVCKYCDEDCQGKHWKFHKADCKLYQLANTPPLNSKPETTCNLPTPLKGESNSVKKSLLPSFPLARYWYDGNFRFYYAYGNTPAEDFLENCTGVKKPKVLVLGCGDIRSCLYTIWKN